LLDDVVSKFSESYYENDGITNCLDCILLTYIIIIEYEQPSSNCFTGTLKIKKDIVSKRKECS